MKIRLLRILFLIAIVGTAYYVSGGFHFNPSKFRVEAVGGLTFTYNNIPLGSPVFSIHNWAPGNPAETRTIDATNSGALARMVSVKGIRSGGFGNDPKIETVLDLVIKDGTTPIYGSGSPTGPKTVADFFIDSSNPNGIILNIINSGDHKTYNFQVTFPPSAGDVFQAKSVTFDLTFGVVTANNLVINEVYYQVDKNHGLDSPKDRGISINGKNITIIISGNGAGSKNSVTVNQTQACKILQSNTTNINNNVNIKSSTGGNQASSNTNSAVNIISGSISTIVNIINGGSSNTANISCGNMLGQNNEWVELFNPTASAINLKNWSLTDNSGAPTKINQSINIPAGGFVLLSKDSSTWSFWTVPAGVQKISLGSQIGDGLDNAGDHLILKDSKGNEVDRMSWGTDTSGFTPPATNPVITLGASTERLTPGFDTDAASDWHEEKPPSVGN